MPLESRTAPQRTTAAKKAGLKRSTNLSKPFARLLQGLSDIAKQSDIHLALVYDDASFHLTSLSPRQDEEAVRHRLSSPVPPGAACRSTVCWRDRLGSVGLATLVEKATSRQFAIRLKSR